MMQVWQFIQQKKQDSKRVMLLYVLESLGSSPGRQGFNMAVSSDGDFCGTIGGGIMEHKFVELAKSRLRIPEINSDIIRQVHDKSSPKNQSGMICSGEQTIFIYEISDNDLLQINKLVQSLSQNKNGTLELTIDSLRFNEQAPLKPFYLELKEDFSSFNFIEKTGPKNILHIIGGGHCALALSQLMCKMDFYIHLYDDRKALSTIHENKSAHEIHIVDSYSHLDELIASGSNVYVVIMTFGYKTDDTALRALLEKSFKYTGLLGSRKKIEKMFNDYKKEKISSALLNNIKAPIGIFIKSETIHEIAVSIAAEIISIKNSVQ